MSSISSKVAQIQRHLLCRSCSVGAVRSARLDPHDEQHIAPEVDRMNVPLQACAGIRPGTWVVLVAAGLVLWALAIGVVWLLLGVVLS